MATILRSLASLLFRFFVLPAAGCALLLSISLFFQLDVLFNFLEPQALSGFMPFLAFTIGAIAQYTLGEKSSLPGSRRLLLSRSRYLLVTFLVLFSLDQLFVKYDEYVISWGRAPIRCDCPVEDSAEDCLKKLMAYGEGVQQEIYECWGKASVHTIEFSLAALYILFAGLFGSMVGLLMLAKPSIDESQREKCKILFLAANPQGTHQLQLDEEIRAIDRKIREAEYRDTLELISRWAVRPDDLLEALNRHRPHIVHFSGHGSPSAEIILKDANGRPKPVGKEVLRNLFTTLKDNIRLVVLNACTSKPQAEAIVEVVDCAVGMKRPIGDKAAITFAGAFYRALGFGLSIQSAFDQGKLAIQLEGIPEEDVPELLVREGVDASQIKLLQDSR